MNVVRLLAPARAAAPPASPPQAGPPPAKAGARIEPIIAQLEDDMRFTMRIIGYEADKAKAKIDESVAEVERIGAASDSLESLSASAQVVASALVESSGRLQAATEAIRRDVAGADAFAGEARLLAAEVGASMGRLSEAVGRIDSVMHSIATIARHTTILALNASIEAMRLGPEGRSFGVLAGEVKTLSDEAQKSAADIGGQLATLHAVAQQSGASVAKIANLIRRIDPVFGSIQTSVQAQSRETAESAAQAAESARFVAAVARSAREVKRLADEANVAAQHARKAGDGVVYAMNRYAQRSTVYLRNSVNGDRRGAGRTPVKVPGFVVVNGRTSSVTALDLSDDGALLIGALEETRNGARARLSLEGLGDCPGRFVGGSDLGRHFKFEAPPALFLARIGRLVAAVAQADAPFVAAVQAGAVEIARAFADGVALGEITVEDLITTDYRPIADTDPAQYETNALAFYERALPPILMKYWERQPEPVFVMATDRNAYIPVHHPRYSLPQRPNEWLWNDLNARNKRIMERWQMLVISRNAEPCYRKVFLRQMKDSAYVPIKAFASPIWVQGRLWGNFQLGYHY